MSVRTMARAPAAPVRWDGALEIPRGTTVWAAALLAVHVPLGMFAPTYPRLAIAHALLTLGVGLAWALLGSRSADRVACVAAYIVGSEVMWRISGAHAGWEFAKYAMLGVMALWMAQRGRFGSPRTATLYFALLVPSSVLTAQAEEIELARQLITFNLIGPLCVMVSAWFFSQVKLSVEQRRHLYLAIIAPAVAVGTIVFRSTVLNPDITFGSESSVEASGGFGPNQVSAALGLGALVALLAMVDRAGTVATGPLMGVCAVGLSVLSALTLSRGGLYSAFASAAIGSLFLLCDARSRIRVLGALALLGLVGYFVVFPAADRFTGGALSSRFSDTTLTNRDEILKADLQIWQEHFWLGVGPGRGNEYREAYIRNTAAHTEYTRMLAEHGVLGLFSLCALVALGLGALRQRRSMAEAAIAAALLTWGALFMLSYGMRLAAPAFAVGLACMPGTSRVAPEPSLVPARRGAWRRSPRRTLRRLRSARSRS